MQDLYKFAMIFHVVLYLFTYFTKHKFIVSSSNVTTVIWNC